jgi:tetratricopeptide (TPR) repeat protein
MATSVPAYAGPNETAAARAEYEQGTAAYNLGKFDDAALHYQAAYNWDRDPNMLFNTAQSFQAGGRLEQALAFFRSYVREAAVDAPYRRVAEKSIEDLRVKVEGPPAPLPVPAPMAPSPEPPPASPSLFGPLPGTEVNPTPTGLVTHAEASSEESPFYKTWWFWTAVGGVVVAGTVTAFLLTRSTSNACDGVGMDCVGVK